MSFMVENLSVRYGETPALEDVSLRFESGALGLLGPNGAGKSSLLRALLGFVRPASGRVTVLGLSPITDPLEVRRRIGYSPEEDAALPAQTGVGAVTLCAELSGLPRHDALQRAHDTLTFVGLGEVRYRRVETYSQGMRQRLKLAQAVVHDPDLVFLDEPTNGLDPRGRQEMLALVTDLVQKGIRVVLSSHLLPDVEAVCDQVAVLDSGRLARHGRLDDLLGTAPLAFEVRVKGPRERFTAALDERGIVWGHRPHGLVHVQLSRPGNHALFEAAAASECQIRQLLPAKTHLEVMFTGSVPGGPRADR
jgi:ABC-2 type transport system ATP-binding protein